MCQIKIDFRGINTCFEYTNIWGDDEKFSVKQKRDFKKCVGFSYMVLFWKVSQAENFSAHFIKK